jgi:hypothetical protein
MSLLNRLINGLGGENPQRVSETTSPSSPPPPSPAANAPRWEQAGAQAETTLPTKETETRRGRALLGNEMDKGDERDEGDKESRILLLTRLLAMPLDLFAREGQLLEVSVPWLAETLWLVPGGADAERLAWEGVNRGRIWTAGELTDLLSASGRSPDGVRAVALAKLELGGEVVEVRRR